MSGEQEVLAAIKGAVASWDVRFHIVRTFTHGDGVQVEVKDGGRWRKVGPLLFPGEGGSLGDTLTMLAGMRAGAVKT